MVLKSAFVAAVCVSLSALAGQAAADEYRPDEFLTLDLSKAALSPKPLGPPAQFEPRRDEAKTDVQSKAVDVAPAQVDAVRFGTIGKPLPGTEFFNGVLQFLRDWDSVPL